MDATEARKLAESFQVTSQYDEIVKLIESEAKKGKTEMWYYNKAINDPTRRKLTELGYKVGPIQSDRNETLTQIKW